MNDMFSIFGVADDVVPAAAPAEAPTDNSIGDDTQRRKFGSTRFRPEVKSVVGTKGIGSQNIIILPSTTPFTDAAAAAMRAKGIEVYDLTPDARREALLPGNSHQTRIGFKGLSHILSPVIVGAHYGDDRSNDSSLTEYWDTQVLHTLYPSMFSSLSPDCYIRRASNAWEAYFGAKKEKWKDNPKITRFLPKTTLNFWGVQLDAPEKMDSAPTIYTFTVPSGPKQAGLGAKLREAMVRIATPFVHNGQVMDGAIVKSLIDPKNPLGLYSYNITKKCPAGSTNPAKDTTYDNPTLTPINSDIFTQTLRGLGWTPSKFEEQLHKYFLYIAANPLFAQFHFADTKSQIEAADGYARTHGYSIEATERGCVVTPLTVDPTAAAPIRQPAAPASTAASSQFSLEELKRAFTLEGGEAELRSRKDLPDLLNSPFVLEYFSKGDVTDYATAIFLQLSNGQVPEDQQAEFVAGIVSIIRELGQRPTVASRNGFMEMLKNILPTHQEMLMDATIGSVALFWGNLA